MFRQMLLGSARPLYAPETDAGADDPDEDVEVDETEDDEGENEQVDDDPDEGEDGDPDEDEPVRKPTRGENRVAAATRTAAEAKAKAESLERELATLRAERNQGNQAETDRQERERVANMSEAERLEYLIQKQGHSTERALAEIRFASWDASDKAAFLGKAAGNPALKGMEAEVEATLIQLRATGQNNTRENIAAYLIGQKALNKMTRSNNVGAKKSAADKERQTGRPANGRGDVAADRGRGDKNSIADLEKRLAGRKI